MHLNKLSKIANGFMYSIWCQVLPNKLPLWRKWIPLKMVFRNIHVWFCIFKIFLVTNVYEKTHKNKTHIREQMKIYLLLKFLSYIYGLWRKNTYIVNSWCPVTYTNFRSHFDFEYTAVFEILFCYSLVLCICQVKTIN